jgi:hypothetical protein
MSNDDANKKTDPLTEFDIFVVNLHTREVHHKNFETAQCQISEITAPVSHDSLAYVRRHYSADPCGFCFRSRH